MAIITTPGAGVSPYETTTAAPTILRASADGSTVSTSAAAAASTVTELAAATANTLVVVSGQAALNSLITSNQPGVFEGANVTINLEEQNFNTTNQVTSTINSPSGNTGEIQYNSGANSFASDPYFTYTNSNVITPGIRTNNYLYANGAPFLAGGNAAIGNFVFTGDNMTISHANSTLNINGNGTGNIDVTANGNTWTFGNNRILTLPGGPRIVPVGANLELQAASGGYAAITTSDGNSTVDVDGSGAHIVTSGINTWTFDNVGNLILPGNTFAVKYANGDTVAISTGGFPLANGTSNIDIATANGNVTVTANGSSTWTFNTDGNLTLPTAGNIVGAVNIIGNGTSNVNVIANSRAWTFAADGNLVLPLAGNIVNSGNTWNFGYDGNLTLPANIIAINYANGNRVTGNITFRDEIVIGTGTSNLISGLYLAPSSSSADANMYLRVRGNISDEPTHIHFDTGNNQYYNQFIGDDNKYIQLANTGNIVINSNDAAGNAAQWNFDTTGVLTLPNADASGFGNIYFEENSSTITFGLDDNTTPYLYSFATSGITLPTGGARIRDTAGNAVAFGRDAAATGPQGNAAVAIGQQAGDTSQGASAVAIGYQAGLNTQGASAVAIGADAGNAGQGAAAVAIGNNAGQTTQGINAIAIGASAGFLTQGNSAVAIGQTAGNSTQGEYSAAFGYGAGANAQGLQAVAIGSNAGADLQGNTAVAIGAGAGFDNQGNSAVAIGYFAGQSAQGNNSIIINATGNTLNQTTANTFTVAPVRNDVANIANIMFYNATTKEITYGNTISVTGNITGNYFIGNGSQLTSVAVPSQTILPTIQSITAVARPAGLFGGGEGGANVTVANTISVTEYGVIITAGTISETYKTGALGSIPGTVSLTFTTGLNSTQYTLFAYVTSNAGTYYSDAVTGTSGICLLAGTQIALSDGTHKAIEDITYTDKLLSWDFDRGCYAETTAVWIKRSETGSQYNLLTFSDGTTLRTFDQHRIFNKQAGAFTYPMTAETPFGTVTVNEHGQEITLTNKQVIQDTIEYYNVITDYHMNLFSDSVLTSCRFNNIYPIVDMKFAKDSRTLRTRAEFENVQDRFFHGLRLAEQTADIETVEWYVNRLLSTEVSTHAELAV
jgi:hypothetical protein